MNIRLVEAGHAYNSTGYYYDFGSNFIFNDQSIENAVDISEKSWGDGGIQIGNQKINSREITITGKFKADTDSINHKINDLLAFCYKKELKLYVIGETTRHYLSGVYFKNTNKNDIIYDDYAEISFNLIVEYPFWINDTVVTSTDTDVDSGDTITITNSYSFNVYPSIEITNNSGSNNPSFRLKNTSDENLTCKIADTNFADGETIIINSVNGTITKGGASILQYLTGTFIKLVPGVNNIIYLGNNNQSITFSYQGEELR